MHEGKSGLGDISLGLKRGDFPQPAKKQKKDKQTKPEKEKRSDRIK